MKKNLLMIATISILLGSSGCTAPHARGISDLPPPVRPQLPTVAARDLQCLTPDTYKTMVMRERLLRQYAEELETVINTVNEAE